MQDPDFDFQICFVAPGQKEIVPRLVTGGPLCCFTETFAVLHSPR